LRLADLVAFTDARLGNLIRHWFQQHGFAPPGARRLREIIQRMIRDPGTAATVIAWSGRELRRYRGWLYLMRSLPCRDPRDEWRWDLDAPFQLPGAGVCLHARRATGVGLAVERLTVPVTVRWRRGGEVCRLPGRSHHHSLKKLFQEKHIPPWQRSRIPLVYADGCLAAVVGLWYCEPFCARPSEPGVEVLTRSADADSIVTQDWLW
jgi:tRNA(Ile)-lysidine synthase